MTYDASTVVYDGSKLDREALFIHSATEAQFVREGRIEYREADGYPRVPFFVDSDAEFSGKQVRVDDALGRDKVFSRESPPAVTYGDFRFVPGEHDEEAGEPTVTVYLDKMSNGKAFPAKHYNEEQMLDAFRRDLERKHSKYAPVNVGAE